MTHWKYRVMEFTAEGETFRAIHEVHYGNDGKPKSYSEPAASVTADIFDADGQDASTRGSLEWTLDRMREALDKPVLQASDFCGGG